MDNSDNNKSDSYNQGFSDLYSSYTRKKGFLGFITAPFRRFIESDFFFIISANFSLKKLIIGILTADLIGTAVYFAIPKSESLHNSANVKIVPLADYSNISADIAENTTEPVTETPTEIFNGTAVIDVPFYSQKDYPTGCELVSTSMLLAYYGIEMNAKQLVTDGYITNKKVYLNKRKVAYGPDPNLYFIGDPFSDSGYGCYSGTIVSALKKILPDDEYSVVDLTGKSLATICKRYIDKGIPVLIWGGIGMKKPFFNSINSWIIDEGDRKGQDFKWLSNEHCLVLIGYDDDYYYFNDPLSKSKNTKYSVTATERCFEELGKMAVAVRKKQTS